MVIKEIAKSFIVNLSILLRKNLLLSMNKALRSRSPYLIYFLPLLTMLLFSISARAQQPGELDTGFNVEDVGVQIGGFKPNLSAVVQTTALQEDGKIIIGGRFINYDGQNRTNIARLNTDGSLDPSFDPGTGFDGGVETIAIQSDGKIIVGGYFRMFNGISRQSIARLNADGSLDTSFDPGAGFNEQVRKIVVQLDGKIIAGGAFTSYNGTDCKSIARLNTDGTLDIGFATGTSLIGGSVRNLAIQPDEKIVVGGSFRYYNDIYRSGIARLNTDGSLDTSFNPGHGVDGEVLTLAIQPDGKIVAAGMFTSFNKNHCWSLVRINADGSHDPSFAVGLNFEVYNSKWFFATAVQPDGKIIVGGNFNSFNNGESGNFIGYIARLHEDGSVDTSFDVNTRFNEVVWSMSLQPDGRIVVGGAFNQMGANRDNISRLNNQGSIDPSFNYASGFDNFVNATAVQQDGKILVGGNFVSFSDKNSTRIARLNADGTFDTSFDSGIGFNSTVMAIAVQNDGKILVGGYFDNYNGARGRGIVRLNADGSLDHGFELDAGIDASTKTFILLPDGKIILGSVYYGDGAEKYSVVKLNSDGTLDATFSPGTGFSRGIEAVAVQKDGKVLVGGNFQDYRGLGLNHIVRFNADGSLDTNFKTGTGFSGYVTSLVIQEDGKIVVIGGFGKFNGTDRKGIARLNADGSLDTGFNPGEKFIGGFSTVALQSGGKLMVAGEFTSYDGISRNRIARLNNNGSLDISFDPGIGFNGRILSTTVQSDANILVGGLFTSYNGHARNYVVRINGGVEGVTGLKGSTFDGGLVVYPNPFTSEFSLKLNHMPAGQVQVLVMDLTGRAVYQEAVITTTGQNLHVKLDSSLPKGIYLLQLRHGKEIGSYRVIKH